MTSDLDTRTKQFGREIFAGSTGKGRFSLRARGSKTNSWVWHARPGPQGATLPVRRYAAYLRQPAEVSRHLREYLGEAKDELPWWVRLGTKLIPIAGFSVARWRSRRNAARSRCAEVHRGSNVAEAVEAVRAMRNGGSRSHRLARRSTITEVEADHVQSSISIASRVNSRGQHTAGRTGDRPRRPRPIPRVNVSVKLSALYSQFDPIDPDGTPAPSANACGDS